MKTTKIIAIIALAAISALSACKSDETAAANTTAPAETVKVTFSTDAETTEGGLVGAAVSGLETTPDITSKLPVGTIETTADEGLVPTVTDTDIEPDFQIHLPAETVEIDVSGLEPYDLGENLGEFKDESYWEQRLGGNDEEAAPVANKVFLVSVDADTTDAMMQEVIDKYSLEVIYDYENFNMYALAVPEPLDDSQTQAFIDELQNNYSFILMVEPDSVMYLDSGVSDMAF